MSERKGGGRILSAPPRAVPSITYRELLARLDAEEKRYMRAMEERLTQLFAVDPSAPG